MARPPQAPPDAWQLEADLLAVGRDHLEHLCGGWRINHLYPRGADPSLLLLAYQELDRRRVVGRVGTSRRALARAMRRILDAMVRRDAIARNRRLAYGLPTPQAPSLSTTPDIVGRALASLDPEVRAVATHMLHDGEQSPTQELGSTATIASERAQAQIRDALLGALFGHPEAIRSLHPHIVAMLASAQPEVQRHPLASYVFIKLPLQLVVALLVVLNLAYVGLYYFFNDEVLGRFISGKVSAMVEGELEMGSVHWNGRLILDLLTGQPSPVTVEDVTVFEPYKSYGGDRRAAAHADRIEASLVLHEIIPWNRLAIPAMFEIPWALHFDAVEIVGESRFDVRGYRDEHEDGRTVSLIGLRDAFALYKPVPNDKRGLSFAVDRATLGTTAIDVDFEGLGDWRFQTTLDDAQFGLRFVSLAPTEGIPSALPLQFSLTGHGGAGALKITDIELPIEHIDTLHMRGGTEDTPYGDVRYDARVRAAGSDLDVDGRLRYALARSVDPAAEPVAYGTPVIWGPAPMVEMRAATRDAGAVLEHVLEQLELPDYAVDGHRAALVARVEGPLSDPVYHLAAEGLSIDPLDESAWVIDDARVSVALATQRTPERWSNAYPAERLVATFDTFEGSALDGTVHLRDGELATIVLPGDDTEPLLLDGDFDLRSVNAAQLVPDDPEMMAKLAGTTTGRVRIDELRLGPITPLAQDGTPMAAVFGLQRARLEFTGLDVERDRGPHDDGLPKQIRLDGTVTIDEQGQIDWDDLLIAIAGAKLRTTGAIDGELRRLGETALDLSIDDGAAFARALAIDRYVDQLRARLVLGGPIDSPTGRDGHLSVTPTVGPVSGATETKIWIDAGVLHARGEEITLLGGRGAADLEVHLFDHGAISDDPRLRAKVDLRGVDLAPLTGGEVVGVADLELDVGDGEGGAARASALRVSGTATVPRLRYAGTDYADATLSFRWTAEQLAIERLVLPLHRRVSPAHEDATDLEVGRLVVDGTVGLIGDPALDLHVEAGGIPLAAVAQLLSTDVPVHGQIGAGTEFEVTGTLSRPSVEGSVALIGLTAFGVPLGSGTLEVESDDAPAAGPLAAHRELWAKGELTTGPRGDARIDWSIDAVVALGKPARRGESPPFEAQLDVSFDRVGIPLLLRASKTEMPGVEGQIEGLAAHVLSCGGGNTMLTDCATDGGRSHERLAVAVSLERAWIRPQARSTVGRQQRATAKSPCDVAGTLCAEGLQATLDGDALRLDRPLKLRSPDGTDAELAGAFDLSAVATATPAAEAATCRAPPPPAPKVAALSGARPNTEGSRATLTGTIALGALQALLEPYGMSTLKGRVTVDVDLDGPLAAPKLSGRLDLAEGTPSLWIQPKGLGFPIELSDIALAITPQWLGARGALRVFGETIEFGSHDGERTGFAFAGPCAGHFDVSAAGTIGTRALTWLLGDAVAGASGGIDVEHAVVAGNASPFAIERAQATLGFADHDLRVRPTEGLDEIALTGGRILVTRCGAGDCTEVPGVPEGALAVYLGSSTEAPAAKPDAEAVIAEIGARGRVSAWGRVYIDLATGAPLHTELDARVVDVAFRDFDSRGRPVAEAEISADRLSLRGADPIVVQGEIDLARARYVKDAIQGTDILAFADDVEIAETPPPDIIRNLQFDLRVATEDPLRVENNVATGVEANAAVSVTGTYDAPEFAGRIDLESGGRVDLPFLTGTYAIQRGRVDLLGAIEDAEVDIGALREEPIYDHGEPRQLQLLLGGTLAEITWTCITDGDTGGGGQSARSCFDYLVLGTGDVQVSDADVRRFGGGGLSEARKPLQVVGHVTEIELDERAQKAVPRLRGYVPDMRLRLGQIGPELRVATPAEWFDFDYGRFSFGWDYTRGYPGFFLRQSRQLTFRLELLEPITLEFSRRIRSYLNQRVIFDPLTQRTLELRFDITAPSAK